MFQSLNLVVEKYKRSFQSILDYLSSSQAGKLTLSILVFAVLYYILVFSLYSIYNHALYSTSVHDVGVYDQIIWLISRFHWPLSTLGGGSLFCFHVSMNCYLLAPMFWFWNNVNALYAAQSCFLACSVFPIYFYARSKLSNVYLALAISLSFLLYPALQGMNLENFHPEAISIFFLAWTFFFLEKKNYPLFFIFAFISMLGKEDLPITVAFIGIYMILRRKETKYGLATLFMGLAYFLLATRILMPWANSYALQKYGQQLIYSHWFGSFSGNLFNAKYYLDSVFNPVSLNYLNQLLAPLCYLPLLSPLVVLCLPQLLINLLSRCGYFTSIYYHYNYAITIFVFYALVDSVYSLRTAYFKKAFVGPVLFFIILLAGLSANLALSPFPINNQWPIIIAKIRMSDDLINQKKRDALKLIPAEANISVSYPLFPHLSHRHKIYMFPNPFKEEYWNEGLPLPPISGHADYVALMLDRLSEEQKLIARFLVASSFYATVPNDSDLMILKRGNDPLTKGMGAKYRLNTLDPVPVCLNQGVLYSIYFPDSKYYLRSLLGDAIPISDNNEFMLEIEGYLYLGHNGLYNFSFPEQAQLEVDDKTIRQANFNRGFHKFKIKYFHANGPINLKFLVYPPVGQPYIVSDQEIVAENNEALMAALVEKFREKAFKQTEFIKTKPNLIKNPSFEENFGLVPRDWEPEYWVDLSAECVYGIDPQNVRKGKRSIKLINKGLVDSRWVQVIYLKPNTTYKISGWIKTINVERKGEGAFLIAEGTPIKTASIFGSQDWQYVEAVGKTGPDQSSAKIQCRLGYFGAPNIGEAYFDDVSLKEVMSEY